MKTKLQDLLLGVALGAAVLLSAVTDAYAVIGYYAPPAAPTVVMRPAYRPAYRPVYQPLFPRIGWRGRPVVAYSPVVPATPVAASPCSPCTTTFRPCTQTVYRYVPQTCYRQQCVSVPVTTCRPVCVTDPCTGCTTTCMRPITTYVQRTQRVPYTTYRLVAEQRPVCPTVSCNPCAACPTCPTGCTSACATGCAAGNCRTGACATGTGDATTRPTLAPAEPTQTFKPGTQETQPQDHSVRQPEAKIEPMRELEHRPAIGPELHDSNDKTAAAGTPSVPRVSMAASRATPQRRLDDSGWRAARP